MGDDSPLVLPALLPLDDPGVKAELARCLPASWSTVIDQDVDGPHALSQRIDSEVEKLGKSSVARRVARTVFFGSAPLAAGPRRGLDAGRIMLGCVLPGDAPFVFGTALRRLVAEAVYLYQEGDRYWYASRPTSVVGIVEHRAAQMRPDVRHLAQAIGGRLRAALDEIDDFSRMHIVPVDGYHVPDEVQTCLVVRGIDHPHRLRGGSAAETTASGILESCGTVPRRYRQCPGFSGSR